MWAPEPGAAALAALRGGWDPASLAQRSPASSLLAREGAGCGSVGTTERLHFHFSLSCIGEGNGNPLQCSCLENPRDGGAWWAAIYGVAQNRT